MSTKLLPNDTGNMPEGLRARIADPFWLLHRQWSLMEFHAEDAGTPVGSSLSIETRSLPQAPLESVVEADRIRNSKQEWRLAAEAGRALVRWMREQGWSDTVIDGIRADFPLPVPPGLDEREHIRARLWAKDGMNGLALETYGGSDPNRSALKAQVLSWLASSHVENAVSNWNPRAMAYEGTVSGSDIQLSYRGYPGGTLDWTAWTLIDDSGIGTETVTTPTPARINIPGLPDRRWWSIEDSNIDLSDPPVEGWRISQLVAAEFAVAHNDDWFHLPVKVQRGVAARVSSLVITDSFGVQIVVPSARSIDATLPHQSFGLWEITNGGDWLVVLPPMSDPLQGPVVERVRFFEDEDANMGWAVEEIASASTGHVVKRSATEFSTLLSEAGYSWHLAARIPSHWYPLVAETVNGVQVDLMQGRLGEQDAPMGQLLQEMPALPEEQVRGPGFIVERRWQRARLPDGGSVSWLGRERRATQPQEVRDLAWDRVRHT